jgi:hypothetical protein
MQINALDNLNIQQTVSDATRASTRGDFHSLLNRGMKQHHVGQMTDSDKQQIRESAQQLVSSSLVLPMLAQIRESSLKSDLFHGDFAEDAFGAQLDTQLADRMVAKSNFSIVEAIYQKMVNPMGLKQTGKELNLHA